MQGCRAVINTSQYFHIIGNIKIPVIIMNHENAVQQLAALAHSTRLHIYRTLVIAGETGKQPGELTELLGLANATLSFHLKTLQQAGLVQVEQQGRHLQYHANYSAMNTLLGFLSENCCQGQPCEVNKGCC
jgi:DNA-binding transcriptional ArsR family regulator